MKDAGIIVRLKGGHFTDTYFRHCKYSVYITPSSFWLHWNGNLRYGTLNWIEIFKYKGSKIFILCDLTIMQSWEIDKETSFKMPFIWKISLTPLSHNIYLHGIFRQDYWSRLPLFSTEDLPDPGSNPVLLCLLHWLESSLPVELPGKSIQYIIFVLRREYKGILESEG